MAIARLLSIATTLEVTRRDDIGTGCYALNRAIGVIIKYATARLTPWSFTFQAAHKGALCKLAAIYPQLLVLLVCNDDGIVALDYASALLLVGSGAGNASISVFRRPREMYSVSGTFGKLPRKLGDIEYARQLLTPSP